MKPNQKSTESTEKDKDRNKGLMHVRTALSASRDQLVTWTAHPEVGLAEF